MTEYAKGFRDGWREAVREYEEMSGQRWGGGPVPIAHAMRRRSEVRWPEYFAEDKPKRKSRKRPASKKQKLLKTMTDKKWKTYKGKKTWIQIRAQVSRSQAYKKKARRLK